MIIKRAIVIGATTDIGKALSKLMVKNGYLVGITDRNPDLLEELKNEHPRFFKIKELDVVNTKIMVERLEELLRELGGLDLVIICSGISGLNEELDFRIDKRTINNHVVGFTCIADWAYHHFEEYKRGHLVTLSSIRGLFINDKFPAYDAVNAYQIHYLASLRQKAFRHRRSIILTDVRCGLMELETITGNRKLWVTTVDIAAQQIMNAIIAEKKLIYITKRWQVLVPMFKLMPRVVYDKIVGCQLKIPSILCVYTLLPFLD